jgi:hypothetical protein
MVYNFNIKVTLILCGDPKMKTLKKRYSLGEIKTWEEVSGLLEFLSSIHQAVEDFNDRLDFGIDRVTSPLLELDGDREMPRKVGFVLERNNPLIPEFRYCLYSLLKDKVLYGYIGILGDGKIRTVKHLQPIENFRKSKAALHGWLTQLVRASCEKIML